MNTDKATDLMMEEKDYVATITAALTPHDADGGLAEISVGCKEPDSYMRAMMLASLTTLIVRDTKYLAKKEGYTEEEFWGMLISSVNEQPSELELRDRYGDEDDKEE